MAGPIHYLSRPTLSFLAKRFLSQTIHSLCALAGRAWMSRQTQLDELQEGLSQQRRKNAQLQEHIFTITKHYEDDRMVMWRKHQEAQTYNSKED